MPEADLATQSDLYDRDFVAWSEAQAELVRAGRLSELDLPHLMEELDAMGGSQRSEIGNRLAVVLEHLLKWQHQSPKRKYGWRSSLIEQRISIEGLIEASPSLQRQPALALPRAYQIARVKAAADTGLPEATFPSDCPYTIEDVLDVGFYPGPEEVDVV